VIGSTLERIYRKQIVAGALCSWPYSKFQSDVGDDSDFNAAPKAGNLLVKASHGRSSRL
jgi:hypothetical protein